MSTILDEAEKKKQKAENAKTKTTKYAKVAIDLPLYLLGTENKYFYYSIPDEISDEILPGSVVLIPFGKQELIG